MQNESPLIRHTRRPAPARRRHQARLQRGGSVLAAGLAAASLLLLACSDAKPQPSAATVPALAVEATVEPARPTPANLPLPPPLLVQEVGAVTALAGEGWLTVVRAEAAPAGSVRLLFSIEIKQPGWTSDALPSVMPSIYLTDQRGAYIPLLEVSGPTATNDTTATALHGWYQFGPLPPGVRRVALTYPVYEDGSNPVTLAFELGNASPPLTPAALAGVWRTALVSEPSAQTSARGARETAWEYERVEFLADGRILVAGRQTARSRSGTYASPNGLRLSITLADGEHRAYAVDEFTPERLVLTRPDPSGAEWIVLTRP